MHFRCHIRFLSSVLFLFTGVLADLSEAASISDAIQYADYQQQYSELKKQLEASVRNGLSKHQSVNDGKILSRQALLTTSDRDPLDVVLRRTDALLNSLNGRMSEKKLQQFESRIDDIRTVSNQSGLGKLAANGVTAVSREQLFYTASVLRREMMLSSPEIDFDTLLFVGIIKPGGSFHMCDQYLGWNAKNGGGLYLLTGIRSGSPKLVDILKEARVESGDMEGKGLTGGACLSPDLSFDGKKIVFAWTNEYDKCFHLFRVNVDGSELVQLTDGRAADNGYTDASHNDFDPCWLPDGRIAFISERRGGYGRCHPRHVPTYTMYSMKDDGSDIVCLSYHETNEWHPSVNNNGQIVYTRWDYLDRDDCIAHHMWLCDPDGCNPRAPHGNYPTPFTTMEGSFWRDGRTARPYGEWNIRAIPGSNKYTATASGHHTHSFGHLIMIDPDIKDDGAMAQVTGITTSKTSWPDTDGPYGTAWPLSESMFLCNYNNQIVLLDKFGNREALYTASGSVRPIDPIPVRERPVPPRLSTKTWQGERSDAENHYRATLGVMNVYTADMDLEKFAIRRMRIIQVFPQFTPLINDPRIGYASESLARMVLGTVPVEEDGSVYCEAPVGKEIYFQLLDEDGRAVHSMRAGTFVHAGEQLTCLGCHEDKWEAPSPSEVPIAFQREPSELEPEVGGVEPVNFYRLAKPVLDEKCASCHSQNWGSGPDMSYGSLKNYAAWWPGPGNPYVNGDIITAKHGGSRTIPGKCGAMASGLLDHLSPDHHDVELTDEEKRRIMLWLDCNANEYGAYTKTSEQRRGELVWPKLDCDPENPTGVESDRPLPGVSQVREKCSPYLNKESGITAHVNVLKRTLVLFNCPGTATRLTIYNPAGRCLWKTSLAASELSMRRVTGIPPLRNGMVIVCVEDAANGRNVLPVRIIK